MEPKQTKQKPINYHVWFLISKFAVTFGGLLLFAAWLMLITDNFYYKDSSSFLAGIASWPIATSIWPVTLIILFIFVLPMWVTNSSTLLFCFLVLSLLIVIANFGLLFTLNVNVYWYYWIVVVLLNVIILIGALFILFQKNKKNNPGILT